MTALVEQAPFSAREFNHPLPDDYPHFCPICGRALAYLWWDTVSDEYRYEAFACFGEHGWLYQWFAMKVRVTWPSGLHYRYDFGPSKNDDRYERRYDTQTGDRL